MTPNPDLFVDVLAHIERDPSIWNQGRWFQASQDSGLACGTAACFAGWACTLAAEGRPVVVADIESLDNLSMWYLPQDDGQFVGISHLATHLLGIDVDNARTLFGGENSLADLYDLSAVILGLDSQVLVEKVAARVAELGPVSPAQRIHDARPVPVTVAECHDPKRQKLHLAIAGS